MTDERTLWNSLPKRMLDDLTEEEKFALVVFNADHAIRFFQKGYDMGYEAAESERQ